jgi:hypothetical protein
MKDLSNKIKKIEQGNAWKENDTVVELKIKNPLDKVIPIRLQSDHWQTLRNEARTLGIGPTTLARMWIIERLRSHDNIYQDPMLKITKDRILNEDYFSGLTAKEYEVVKLLFRGYPPHHIAKILDLDIDNMDVYVTNILKKISDKQNKSYQNKSYNEINVES